MEFPFDLNAVLPNEITKVTNSLSPFRNIHSQSTQDLQKHLCKVIDAVGIASSRAQGLSAAITSSIKLKGSEHRLYIYKDSSSSEGKQYVIGILRVGIKKLFVVDFHGQHIEVHPVCVLDFYVHESKQRSGYGKRLFDHMLREENVKPEHLAIDRPSSKFLNFLKKHYLLKNAFPQMNKFVVFDQFFRDLSAVGFVAPRRRFASSAPALGRPIPDSRHDQRPHTRNIFGDNELSYVQYNRKATHSDLAETKFNGSLMDSRLLVDSRPNSVPRALSQKSGVLSENIPEQNRLADGCSRQSTRQGMSAYSRYSYNPSQNNSKPQSPIVGLEKISPGHQNKDERSPSVLTNSNKARPPQQKTRRNLQESSSDNPLSLTGGLSPARLGSDPLQLMGEKTKLKTANDTNYTVSAVGNGRVYSQRPALGTSWNVFGVPSGTQFRDTNPYMRMGRRNFPR